MVLTSANNIKTIVMVIYVKNMISQRCKIVVNNILQGFGLQVKEVTIGEIRLEEKLPGAKLLQLDAALKETGLELVFDKKDQLVQQIKNIIFEIVYFRTEPIAMKFSCYLSKRLNYNYTYLAGVFKKLNGITIEHFMIAEKIEKVKSMLVAEGVHLSEIAFKMNYSSVSHLSAQFKKMTGFNASEYRLLRLNNYVDMQDKVAV
jgi:AraC-like DNA-binding protein